MNRKSGPQGRDAVQRRIERGEIGVVAGVGRQGQVQVAAGPVAGAALIGMASEEGVEFRRIAMQGNGQNVGPAIEDALGAVAGMNVDIQDCRALAAAHGILGGNRDIVQETEAAGRVGKGVMPRRPAQAVGGRRAVEHQFGGVERGVGAAAGRVPGLRPDRA